MKIRLDPAYAHLETLIRSIPEGGYSCAETFRRERNTVEKIVAEDGTVLVVKRYKRPTRINQVVYSGLRWSKPRRSYKFAGRLREMGVDTADRVAYIEVRKYGFYHTGYYISRFVDDPMLSSIQDWPGAEREKVLAEFARFTVMLHTKGIRHNDYNPGNIFFRREGDAYRFSIIDINRIQFGRLSRKACAKEFRRMGLSSAETAYVAECYANLRGWKADLFCGGVLLGRGLDPHWTIKRILHAIARPFGGKK